jgi:hypothetical protein
MLPSVRKEMKRDDVVRRTEWNKRKGLAFFTGLEILIEI